MKTGILSFVTTLLAYSASVAQTTVKADTTTTASAAPVTPVAALNTGLTLSGYIEAYYARDFTAPKTAQERPGFLYNHKRNGEVNINLAFMKAAYSSESVRGNLALQAGTYPQYNYAAEQPLIRTIFEANAGVKLSKNHDLWLDVGIFPSHIGFESAISRDCWTLTRSMLAENSPYYLAGAKVTYNAPNTKWVLLGSVLNGWQRVAKLPGYSGMALSTQVQYKPSAKVILNWSSFLGSDRPDSLKQGRFFNNFYAIINPAGNVGVTLGFDVGADRKPVGPGGQRVGTGHYVWFSPVVIVRCAAGSRSFVAGRIEYYNDRNGVIISTKPASAGSANGFRTVGFSLNYDYAVLPNALLRIEGKVYASKDAIFETATGRSTTNTALTTSLAISF